MYGITNIRLIEFVDLHAAAVGDVEDSAARDDDDRDDGDGDGAEAGDDDVDVVAAAAAAVAAVGDVWCG